MNNIFEKNINALYLRNKVLAKKLELYIPEEVPQLVQNGGGYNFLYKNTLMHNSQNPLEESIAIFSGADNSPVSIHIVFGLGLGYLFQTTVLKSKGSVVLYEPNLDILKTAFMLVDFSEDIKKKNVEITDNLEELSLFLYKKSATKNTPQMLSLPTQRALYSEKFEELVNKIQELVGTYSLDLKYTKEKFYPSLKMLIENLPNLVNETPILRLKDLYKGEKALVISAGPTLDKNIETIKKYRKNVVIFAVGTALKTLIKNDIIPDFLLIIETFDSSKQLEGLNLKEVNFISEPYSNPAFRKFEYKKCYTHISYNNQINQFWGKISGENILEYETKGTVSYTALNCARLLGFQDIILVGQDLAYIEGQCYSKDSVYKDLVCKYNTDSQKYEITANDMEAFANSLSNAPTLEERMETAKRRLNNLNSSLHYVKGIKGEKIPTESVYAAFINPLEEYVKKHNDRNYINTSMEGAEIEGFKNIPLKEALKNSEEIELKEYEDLKGLDKTNIIKNIQERLMDLKKALPLIEEGQHSIRNLNNDLKRAKAVNETVLRDLKKVMLNYLALSSDFTNQSELFEFITKAEKLDLDYEMELTEKFDEASVKHISEKINNYFISAKERIQEIEDLINQKIGEIS